MPDAPIDFEALAIGYLLTDTATENVFGDRVAEALPATWPDGPRLVVILLGATSSPQHGKLQVGQIQVDACSTSPETGPFAFGLAQVAYEALLRMPAASFDGIVVSWTEATLGIRSFPDPETARSRYQFGFAIHAHRAATS